MSFLSYMSLKGSRGLGDGSVGKELAWQARGPGCDSQNPGKIDSQDGTHVCNPGRKVQTAGPLWLAGCQSSPFGEAKVLRDSISKEVDSIPKHDTQDRSLSSGMCTPPPHTHNFFKLKKKSKEKIDSLKIAITGGNGYSICKTNIIMVMEQSLEGKGGEEEAGAEDVKSF